MSESVDFIGVVKEKLEKFRNAKLVVEESRIELVDAQKALDAYMKSILELTDSVGSELGSSEESSAVIALKTSEETGTDTVVGSLSQTESDVEGINEDDVEPAKTAVSDESSAPKKSARKSTRSSKDKDAEEAETVVNTDSTPDEPVLEETTTDEESDEVVPDETPDEVIIPAPEKVKTNSSDSSGLWDDDDDDDFDELFNKPTKKTNTAASGVEGGLFDSTNVDEVQF